MINLKALITTLIFTGFHIAKAAERVIAIDELDTFGFPRKAIERLFSIRADIQLNPNEILKVAEDEEGNNFKFETLDHHTIIVPIAYASGGFNKKTLPAAKSGKNE